VVLWTEPVLRTIYLGQVNLVLMALILWDLCQPDTENSRWWKGFGTGIAAGIKLVPLIFIPYLLLARKFRQAAMALAGFVFSVLLGFVILPGDSSKWWFDGLFAQGGRTGFVAWAGNQSLDGFISRLSGSVNGGKHAWIAVAVVIGIIGVLVAARLDRRGYQVLGLLGAALTGLLVSPISWDHHWVWIAPGALVAGHYAVRAWRSGAAAETGGGVATKTASGAAATQDTKTDAGTASSAATKTASSAARAARRTAVACGALALAIVAWFGAWPAHLFTKRTNLGNDSLGLLWIPRNTNPVWYIWYGDRPGYPEYHWHGLALIVGNAYVLAGLALLGLLLVLSLRLPARPAPPEPAPAGTRTGPKTGTKEQRDEPGRGQAGLRGRLRLPAA
jgi:alpha-1,2-mannosyltransferase